MTSRDFCYWLQGYLEITSATGIRPGIDSAQVECIKRHLGLVFKHEIDPSMGAAVHQGALDALHKPPPIGGTSPDGLVMRC